MISFWSDRQHGGCFAKKTPFSFFSHMFKKKKIRRDQYFEKGTPTSGIEGGRGCSKLSVSVMDMRMMSSRTRPISPALSTITLTPGRTRDIDQDMETLRLSRQDNPFLQILASRESLIDVSFESDLDSANLMIQSDKSEIDPLSLPEVHVHMIRSPPPSNWPKSPNFKAFKFPGDEDLSQDSTERELTSRRLNENEAKQLPEPLDFPYFEHSRGRDTISYDTEYP